VKETKPGWMGVQKNIYSAAASPESTESHLAPTCMSRAEKDRALDSISSREREVLALIAQGMTNRQIAEQLVISENTARNHVSRILDKLGLARRSEAAVFAAQHGLAPQSES